MKDNFKPVKNTRFDKYLLLTRLYYKKLFSVYDENKQLNEISVDISGFLLLLSLFLLLCGLVIAGMITLFYCAGNLIELITILYSSFWSEVVTWVFLLISVILSVLAIEFIFGIMTFFVYPIFGAYLDIDPRMKRFLSGVEKFLVNPIAHILKYIYYAVISLPVLISSLIIPIISACVFIFLKIDGVKIESELTGIEGKYIRFRNFDPEMAVCPISGEYLGISNSDEKYEPVVKASNGKYYRMNSLSSEHEAGRLLNVIYTADDELPEQLLYRFEPGLTVQGRSDDYDVFKVLRYHREVVRTIYGNYFDRDCFVSRLENFTKQYKKSMIQYTKNVRLRDEQLMTLFCCEIKRAREQGMHQTKQTKLQCFAMSMEIKIIPEIYSYLVNAESLKDSPSDQKAIEFKY